MSKFEEAKRYSVTIVKTADGKTQIADAITSEPVGFVRLALDDQGPGFYSIMIYESVGEDGGSNA